jgi:hypothetical protein
MASHGANAADADILLRGLFGLPNGRWLCAPAAHGTEVAEELLANELVLLNEDDYDIYAIFESPNLRVAGRRREVQSCRARDVVVTASGRTTCCNGRPGCARPPLSSAFDSENDGGGRVGRNVAPRQREGAPHR